MLIKIVLLITFGFAACKPLGESQIQTNSADSISFEEFNREYIRSVEEGTSFSINTLKKFELRLTKAIDNNPQQHLTELRKIRHKVRGFIIQLLTCGNPKKSDRYKTEINDQNLCSLIAHKLQAMTPQIIDSERIDEDFYYQVFLAGKYDINKPLPADKQRLYRDLLEAIARINDASMEKYSSMLPFAKIDWFNECQRANMRPIDAGQRIMSVPSVESLQKDSRCQQLKGHAPQALAFDQQVLVYPNIETLIDHLRYYVMRLNVIRHKINKILRLKSKDPAVKKESFLWVVRDVIHMTDFDSEGGIVKLHESYYATLIEVAQQRLLPILLDIYRHRLYLNPKGRLFGFAMVRHDELKYPDQETVQRAVKTITNKVASHYLRINEARNNKQQLKDKEIFQWLIHNEIAAAQIILQNPQHALVANHLIHVYQDKFQTPKWLQNLKTWSHRLDIIMIPASIIGSILAAKFAPPLAPAITNASIAVNFFWIASATADTVVAFRRYQIIERALVSGTSVDAKRGVAYANEFKSKIDGAVVSVGLGGGLTIKALQLAGKKAGKWATTTDISAALLSELPTGGELDILGNFNDGTTHKEEHNKK